MDTCLLQIIHQVVCIWIILFIHPFHWERAQTEYLPIRRFGFPRFDGGFGKNHWIGETDSLSSPSDIVVLTCFSFLEVGAGSIHHQQMLPVPLQDVWGRRCGPNCS